MKIAEQHPMDLAISGRIGIGWGCSGGEPAAITIGTIWPPTALRMSFVFLKTEDEKFAKLQFIELNACSGGCVGGVLNVENPYVAKAKIKRLNKYLPVARTHSEDIPQKVELGWHTTVEYEPVFRIGDTMLESITKMKQIEELCNEFPGLDCGSCGAPSCRALQKISSGAKPRKTTVFTFSAITFICFSETYHASHTKLL